jgi:Domain of unknown function (DUF397)
MKPLNWFTSSYSSGNGACIEAARLPEGGMAVRDTKNRSGAVLSFKAEAWRAFLADVRQDQR